METEEYNKLGQQASLGCVRLSVVDAKWIYDKCRIGTKVVINDKKQLVAPENLPIKISTASKIGWDPTDPDKKNPYYPKIIVDNTKTVAAYGSIFDPLSCIAVYSSLTAPEELLSAVTVAGKVNTMRPGKYILTYTVTDPRTELKTTKKVDITVVNP